MIKSANLTASVSRQAGGLFDAILYQVQAHDRRKMDARVFGLRDEFTEADLAAWRPVPVAAFNPSGPKSFGYSRQFREELAAFAPDLTHAHGLWLYPSVADLAYHRKTKRPCLISPHGMLDPWALKNSRWKKRIAYALFEGEHLRGARCLRALCASEAQSIRRLGLKNDLAIIPNGIDLPAGAPAAPAPWADRIGPGKKVLLFLSRLHPKKGLVNLLKAWAQNRKSDDWVLAIAGWDQGGHEAELKCLCVERQIPFADLREPANGQRPPATVLFLGPQFNEAKAACYYHCDAFVLPSFSEGLPIVVLEAWANAKPVVMTSECNLPEGFQAGAAVKVDPTEASIAAGLNTLRCLTPEERAMMGCRARDLVVARFTWPRVARQVEEVYEWMLGGGARPGSLTDF
jgi:poly(glycerol-phosphate) alpha-glucosyltransferase